jgi:hypothetical protein
MLTDVRRLCGQLSGGPTGVDAQSMVRIRRAISLSPGNRSGARVEAEAVSDIGSRADVGASARR